MWDTPGVFHVKVYYTKCSLYPCVTKGTDRPKNKKVTPIQRMTGHFFLWRRLMFIALHRINHIALRQIRCYFRGLLIAAWAAASRAMGTRKGEQET